MHDARNRRQIAAAETQRVIVAAATRLFIAQGYQATSVAQIAEQAGVAVQTIYNSIGAKRDVLSRVLDFAASGEQAPVPVPVFMQARAEPEIDPRRIIDQLVDFWGSALARTAPIFRVIRQAAALDPEVAELERRRAEQRLRNYGQAARLLARRGGLRPELGADEAAAVIFTVGHPDTYRFLVVEQGWTVDRWSAWVRETLSAALLPPE